MRVNLYNNKGGTSYQQEHVDTHAGYIGLDYTTNRSRTTFDAGIISNRIDNAQYRLRFIGNALRNITAPPRVDINSKFGAPGTFRQVRERFGVPAFCAASTTSIRISWSTAHSACASRIRIR